MEGPRTTGECTLHKVNSITTVESEDILRIFVSQKEEKSNESTTAAISSHKICPSVAASVCGKEFLALIDTGSSDSFISRWVVKLLKLSTYPLLQNISIALTTLNTRVLGHCLLDLILNSLLYSTTQLGVVKTSTVTLILPKNFRRNPRCHNQV